jgi:hypothetical protein
VAIEGVYFVAAHESSAATMSIHIDVYVEENFHLNILGNVPSKGSHL